MPHVWTVLGRLAEPEVAGAATTRTVGAAVASGALFTLGLALGLALLFFAAADWAREALALLEDTGSG